MFLYSCAAVFAPDGGGFCARAVRKMQETPKAAKHIENRTRKRFRIGHTSIRWTQKSSRTVAIATESVSRKPELLGAEFAAFRERSDAVGGAKCERFDGHGGLAAAGRDETAAVAEEQVFHVVRAMIRIDDGSFRVASHTAGSEQM